jgi:SET domain-containing protein
VKIAQITDPAHPAYGQAGLFAAKDLKPGSFIIEYLGVIHSSPPPFPSPTSTSPSISTSTTPLPKQAPDPHASSNYDLSLDRDPALSLAIDAATSGNEARFINDYRGIRSRPNAEFREVWNEARQERGMGVWVLPVGRSGSRERGKGVRKGEEIVVSYGKGFWGARRGEEGEVEC